MAAVEARHPTGDGWDWAVPLLLVLVHLVLAFLAFDPTPHTGGDNAAYIALARSLLEGRGYRELWDPSTSPHTIYPPVFPALLALAMLVGLKAWVGLKVVVVAASAAAVCVSFLWLRRRFGRAAALAIGAILAASPGVVGLSFWVLSDVPFWLLTMIALWGFERLDGGERGGIAVAVAATVLAYFTRSAGLPLALAAVAWLALRRRWRTLTVLAATLLPLALLWWLRARAHGGVEYVDQFWMVNPYRPELGTIGPVDLIERVWANNFAYLTVHLPILLFGRSGGFFTLLGILVGIAALVGWGLRVRRPSLVELYFPLYIGLLYAWPAVWAGDRFLLPALPILLGYAAYALVAGVRKIGPAAGHWALGAVTVLVLALGLPAQIDAARLGQACTVAYRTGVRYPCLPEPWSDFFAIAEWASSNVPDDAVVLSRKPRLFYALSGRRGRIYPPSPEPAALVQEAMSAGAQYIVLDYLTAQAFRNLIPALTGRPDAFCVVHGLGPERAMLFGVMPGADTIPDRAESDALFAYCPSGYVSSSAPR